MRRRVVVDSRKTDPVIAVFFADRTPFGGQHRTQIIALDMIKLSIARVKALTQRVIPVAESDFRRLAAIIFNAAVIFAADIRAEKHKYNVRLPIDRLRVALFNVEVVKSTLEVGYLQYSVHRSGVNFRVASRENMNIIALRRRRHAAVELPADVRLRSVTGYRIADKQYSYIAVIQAKYF